MSEPIFESFQAVPLEPTVLQAATEMGEDYCMNKCPVKNTLRMNGMVCSFMIREAFKNQVVVPLTGTALREVAVNTWLHCVDEMQSSERPIVLIHDAQNSYTDIASYLG